MTIPESQLDIWSKQGSVSGSSDTYNAIKNALGARGTPYAGKEFSIFLQGSYGNDTNIYAESDVDIVINLDSTFRSDVSHLSESQLLAYNRSYSSATYQYDDFKDDVLSVLTDAYGRGVEAGSKAIMVPGNGSRRKADVIVALEYRRYFQFNGLYDQNYAEGIIFSTSSGAEIINYPKLHSKNLTSKHQGSGRCLKPMVRVFKNIRRRLLRDGKLESGDAPTYYLEGLLYNVPSDEFAASYGDCFCNAINWIRRANKTQFVCANEQYYLLRERSPVCWEPAKCDKFLTAAAALWNEWGG